MPIRYWTLGRPVLLIAVMALVPMLNGSVRGVSAQGETPLIVDNAASANPDLAPVELSAAGDAQAPGSQLLLPGGFAATVVASGLAAPRFMAFDRDGSLLVADQDAGAIYRYGPNADTTIEPSGQAPEPLIAGLNGPSSLAFTDVDGATWLYVGEESQITRFPYGEGGEIGEGEVVVPDLHRRAPYAHRRLWRRWQAVRCHRLVVQYLRRDRRAPRGRHAL